MKAFWLWLFVLTKFHWHMIYAILHAGFACFQPSWCPEMVRRESLKSGYGSTSFIIIIIIIIIIPESSPNPLHTTLMEPGPSFSVPTRCPKFDSIPRRLVCWESTRELLVPRILKPLDVSVSFELPMIPLDWSNWKIWLPFGDQTGRQLLTVAPFSCPPHQLLSIWPRRPRVWKVFGPWFQQSQWELAHQSNKPRNKAKNFSSWAFFWKVWQQHVGTVADAVQFHRLPSGRQQKLDYLQWEVPESYCQELKINQQLHEQAAKTETKAEKIAKDSDPLNFSLQLFNLCWPKALGVSFLHKAQTGEFTLNRHPLFLSHKLYQDRIRRANSVPPPRKRIFRNWWDTMMTEKVHAHSGNEKGLLTGCWTIIADHRCPIKGTSTTTTKRPQLPPTTSN